MMSSTINHFFHEPKVKGPIGVRKKGEGAWYGPKIKELGETRLLILEILKERYPEWTTSYHATYLFNKKRKERKMKNLKFGSISGRLSELLGQRNVEISNKEVDLFDKDLIVFGWSEKPAYRITKRGMRVLEENRREVSNN